MDRFNKPLIALIVVFGAIVLAAMFADMWYSRRGFEPALDNPQVLRVYPVPTARAQDIRTALAATLDNGAGKSAPLGRVMLSGTNQLVVLAPLATQESIAKAIDRLGGDGFDPNQARAATAPAGVRIGVWIVDATGASGDDDEALAPLADALAATRSALGETSFRLHDTLAVSTIPNGGSAQLTSGLGTRIGANLRPANGGVQAELDIAGEGPGRIATMTTLPFGQYVVLAQIALPGESGATGDGARLYVVRADLARAGG